MGSIYKRIGGEEYDREFSKESVVVSKRLENVYEKIAIDRDIDFLKASEYVSCCDADQEHLNAQGREIFADAVYQTIKNII